MCVNKNQNIEYLNNDMNRKNFQLVEYFIFNLMFATIHKS